MCPFPRLYILGRGGDVSCVEGQWPDRNQTCPRKPPVCVLDKKSCNIFFMGCRRASQGLRSMSYFHSCRHNIDVAMCRAPPRCQLTHAACANLVDPSKMLLLLPHWNSMELGGATLSHSKGGALIMSSCQIGLTGPPSCGNRWRGAVLLSGPWQLAARHKQVTAREGRGASRYPMVTRNGKVTSQRRSEMGSFHNRPRSVEECLDQKQEYCIRTHVLLFAHITTLLILFVII